MDFNRGDYVKLTEGVAQLGIYPKEVALLEVYWWNGGNKWSRCYAPNNLTLVQPTELPDYAIELRSGWGFDLGSSS